MSTLNINRKHSIYSGAITRIGNSQGIRLPQDILKQVNLFADFSQVKGGQIPVDIIVDEENIIIRRKVDPEEEQWSQEKQSAGIAAFLNAVGNYTEEERGLIPDAEEFRKSYGIKFRNHDPSAFEFENTEV